MASPGKKLIIIPAFNELSNLTHLKERLDLLTAHWDILIVDDGSRDGTYEWLRMQNRYQSLSLPFNTGIGGAMHAGYRFALENGYDYALQLDGDGQHPPEEAEKLVAEMQKSGAALVVGSRFVKETDYSQGPLRRLGARLLFRWLRWLAKQEIHDPTSGFRLANRETIALFAEDYPSDYPEVETLARLLFRGLTVKEVSVTMHQRHRGKTTIHFRNSLYYMIKVPFSILIQYFKAR